MPKCHWAAAALEAAKLRRLHGSTSFCSANVRPGCAREEPFSIHGLLLNISAFLHITMHPIQHFPRVKKSTCNRAIGAPCTPSLGPIRWLPSPSNRTSIAIAVSPALEVTSLFFCFFFLLQQAITHTHIVSLSVSLLKHTRKMETEM